MKNAILIIEGTQKISEALLYACADRPIDGLNFYVAKTQQAADKLLSERNDIAAVITQDNAGLHLKLLDEQLINDDLIRLQKMFDATMPMPDSNASDYDDDTDDCECFSARDEYIKHNDREELDCSKDITCYKSASGIRRSIDPDAIADKPSSSDLSDMLDLLERYGLLRNSNNNSGNNMHCEHHEAHVSRVAEVSAKVERLSKDVENIILDIKRVQKSINDCPLKKSLMTKALNAKPAETGCSKPIIAGVLGLIGVLATAFSGLLGKVIDIVLNYYYK